LFAVVIFLPVALLLLNGFVNPQSEEDNNEALIDLGRYLFFDPRLSGDGSMSCSTCHSPEFAWTDGEALSEAYPGSDGFRNAKSLLNVSRNASFYWDGRLVGSDVETLVRDGITETHFLNLDGRLLLERMKQVPEYVQMYQDALGSEPSFGGTLKAIAAFQNTLTTGDSPYDLGTMSESGERGRQLFEGKAACSSCHSDSDFTDGMAHNTGVPENVAVFEEPLRHATYRAFIKNMGVPGYMQTRRDVGRFIVTKNYDDVGAFITPGLRQVADTGPYMHNGVFSTLQEVVLFYNNRGDGLDLSDTELDDLVAFLESLSGALPEVKIPEPPPYQAMKNWREARN